MPDSGESDKSGEGGSVYQFSVDGLTQAMLQELTLLERLCLQYLSSKHVTLWGDFNIGSLDGRIRGAKWLAKQIQGIEQVAGVRDDE